jgi:hypothetical protein
MKTTQIVLLLAVLVCFVSANEVASPEHRLTTFFSDMGDGLWRFYYTIYNFVNEKLYFYTYWPMIELFCRIMAGMQYSSYDAETIIGKCRNGAYEAIRDNSDFHHFV